MYYIPDYIVCQAFFGKFFRFFKKSRIFEGISFFSPFTVHKYSLNCPFLRIFFRQNGKTMWYYDVTPSSLPIKTKISFHHNLSFVFHPLIFIKNSDKKHHLTLSSKGWKSPWNIRVFFGTVKGNYCLFTRFVLIISLFQKIKNPPFSEGDFLYFYLCVMGAVFDVFSEENFEYCSHKRLDKEELCKESEGEIEAYEL